MPVPMPTEPGHDPVSDFLERGCLVLPGPPSAALLQALLDALDATDATDALGGHDRRARRDDPEDLLPEA